MTPAQCRAARAWLSWSQDDLAKAARVGLSTVKDFEGEGRTTMEATQTAMLVALGREGLGFPFADVDGEKKACGITFSAPEKVADSCRICKLLLQKVGRAG